HRRDRARHPGAGADPWPGADPGRAHRRRRLGAGDWARHRQPDARRLPLAEPDAAFWARNVPAAGTAGGGGFVSGDELVAVPDAEQDARALMLGDEIGVEQDALLIELAQAEAESGDLRFQRLGALAHHGMHIAEIADRPLLPARRPAHR